MFELSDLSQSPESGHCEYRITTPQFLGDIVTTVITATSILQSHQVRWSTNEVCKKCIEDLITEVGIESCPICEVDWGSDPVKKMRSDSTLQSLRDKIFSKNNKTMEATEVVSTPNMTKGLEEEMMSLLSLSATYKSPSPSEDSQEGVEPEGRDSPKTSSSSALKVSASSSKKEKGKKMKIKSSQKKELARGGSSQSSLQVQGAAKTKPFEDESIWITIKASENQEGVPLPPITPTCYMKIKDGSMKISGIQKYVQNKLGLESAEEIEIKCMEVTIPLTMEIRDVYQLGNLGVGVPKLASGNKQVNRSVDLNYQPFGPLARLSISSTSLVLLE
ncbi:hypothetical protein RIF29_23362 [Crotalaria pallida]|uniref:Uncharacterized protein n=1 Tax=Crotalaria pallida TaxID=3830 RepID=A0AAN9IAX3_CROPI